MFPGYYENFLLQVTPPINENMSSWKAWYIFLQIGFSSQSLRDRIKDPISIRASETLHKLYIV